MRAIDGQPNSPQVKMPSIQGFLPFIYPRTYPSITGMAGRGTNGGCSHCRGAVVPVDPTVAPAVAPTVAPAVHQPCAAARNQRDCHLPTQYHDAAEDSEFFNIDDVSEESSKEEVTLNHAQAQHSNLVPPANAMPTAQTTPNPTCTPAATLVSLMMAPLAQVLGQLTSLELKPMVEQLWTLPTSLPRLNM